MASPEHADAASNPGMRRWQTDIPTGAESQNHARILALGRNAWRIERATRAAILIDADCYYRRLEQALLLARRSIWILGWDFNGRISLRPDCWPAPRSLGNLLRGMVEQHQELEIRLLIWSLGSLYSQKKPNGSTDEEWADHPRIHFRLDSKHPLRGSHHQKLVCIDDGLAFAGGIDLTVKRWDTSDHLAAQPARCEPDGTPYAPVHDVQMAVEGNAARALADLARERWCAATGEACTPIEPVSQCWPSALVPDLLNLDVAIARTWPGLPGHGAAREVAQLNQDALRSARRVIYIETQYFASSRIGRILASRLREKEGPEIVVVVTETSHGLLERFVMGGNRDRLIRRLKKADRFGRLRVMYAVQANAGKECEVLIHSKVMIVDDSFLRVGSSNLNNRSEGLDTECDLAVEAENEHQSKAIAGLRERLLGEHLGCTPQSVHAAIEDEASLVRAIDRLNTNPRGLREFKIRPGRTGLLLGTGLLDPKRPYWPLQWLVKRIKFWVERVSGGMP
ncbi:MAG TPA: phospholipase D-like domain-containing protein [Rhizobiaceae bacterium]|nr:phospholipase D-like domain-containing protein [Rhizobiaceae bacterium]